MTEQEKKGLSLELSSLSVFRQILDTDTLKALMGFLSNNCIEDKARLFGQFVFSLADDEKPIAVYAYCNLHGLWKTNI